LAVLLAAADDRLFAVLVVDGATTVLPLGRPRRVREVDVDLLRAWARPHAAATSKAPDDPLRPSAGTKAHHIRIVPGRRVELGEGPTISQVLKAVFADIEARATTPPKPPKPPRRKPASTAPKAASADEAPKRPKLKGKTWVPLVLKYLRKMALKGSRDLVGLSGTIIAAIQARFPKFKITGEAFADALKLIAATGTCLIGPREDDGRIWRINLEGLRDPTSAQHRRLCRETRGRVRVEEAAANQRSPGPDAPAAGDEPSSTVDAAPGDATDKGNPSPDERSDTPTGPDTAAPDACGVAEQATPASTTSVGQADALELVRQRGMILIAGYIFLLACRLGVADAGQHTDAPSDEAARVDASARIDEAVTLDPMDDGAGPVVAIEAAPHVDEAVTLDAPVVAEVEDDPPAEEAVVPSTAGVSAAGVGDPPGTDQAVVGDGAAEDVWADKAVAPIASSDGAASDGTADTHGAPPCGAATPEHVELAADADRPTLRYGARRSSLSEAFAPVQPAPRCRDLGTLGPRGPPPSRRG
jgi:hypothetical protein